MLNLAMVEDEDEEARNLTEHIEKYFSDKGEKYALRRFKSAVEFLREYNREFDIVFMDIVLPKINGINAAKKLREIDEEVTLIFVTNMANLAVKGYEVSALDFIVKPVVYDSFAMKMQRAINAVKRRRSVEIAIQTDRLIKVLSASAIHYVEVSRHNLVYHTEEGDFNSRGTLESVEKKLSGENFVRCNICYLVNLKYITEVAGENLVVAGDTLKISRARKKVFMQALTNFLGKRE